MRLAIIRLVGTLMVKSSWIAREASSMGVLSGYMTKLKVVRLASCIISITSLKRDVVTLSTSVSPVEIKVLISSCLLQSTGSSSTV